MWCWRIAALSVMVGCGIAALGAGAGGTPPGDTVLRGQTEPAARVEVPSAVKGILAEVNVKEGQGVRRGQQVARLDDALQKQKVEFERVAAEATAEIRYAENQVEYAQMELQKIREAKSPELEILQKELALKQARVAVDGAKDKQRQAQARFMEEQLTLDRMTIRSPIDGQVLTVKKQAGELTDEGPVMVVVQTSRLHAIFYPAKELFGKITVGDKVTLDLEGQKRAATVVTIDPIMDAASQIFRVKLEVENPDGKLAAGVGAVWTWPRK
jgi:membrane fusion protein, multidrug efflux system